MSRAGGPSARGAHKRNLVGPSEILRRIESHGGLPDSLIEDVAADTEPNSRTEAAREAIASMMEDAGLTLDALGFQHERFGSVDLDDPDALAREVAWTLSVTNAMKESVPRAKWCRHMRAADPHLTELRTAAVLKAGVWMCVECMREAGPDVLNPNPWPDECDLCGATISAGHFNEMAFTLSGCFVNCSVCDECAGFRQTKPTEP